MNEIMQAEAERLAVREGETFRAYVTRMGHPKCTCPTAYSMCKYGVFYDQQRGNFTTHGGWGWTTGYGWPTP